MEGKVVDKFDSYKLNDDHRLQYFWPDPKVSRLLKRIRGWLKENDVFVLSVDVQSHFNDETEAYVHSATITYLENF